MQSATRSTASLFATGARITTPLGAAMVRSSRALKARPELRLYEVQLDNETCIRTFTEDELIASTSRTATVTPLPFRARYVTGESVSTPAGDGIIRNLLNFSGIPHAIVQFIGTQQTQTFPCAELSPPLEAA